MFNTSSDLHSTRAVSPAAARVMRWLRATPDSIVARIGSPWTVMVHLVWLIYVVGVPIFVPDLAPWRLVLTCLSVPVFLLTYWRAYFGPERHMPTLALAMSVLALAVVAVSSSWSYVIYAGVMLSTLDPPRRAVRSLLALMAGFAVVGHFSGFSPLMTALAVLTTVVICGLTFFQRQNQRRDAVLRLSHEEVRRLAAMAERERIGRDLHDLLGHTLSLITIKSELADKLFERDPARARDELRETQQIAREALAQVRSAVTGIRATGLAAELASSRLMLEAAEIALTEQREPLRLPAELEDALAMVLREAVTNVQRHARARTVVFSLRGDEQKIEMRVRDDGQGGEIRLGNGLRGMRERLAAFGGAIDIESSAQGGTCVCARVPAAALPELAA